MTLFWVSAVPHALMVLGLMLSFFGSCATATAATPVAGERNPAHPEPSKFGPSTDHPVSPRNGVPLSIAADQNAFAASGIYRFVPADGTAVVFQSEAIGRRGITFVRIKHKDVCEQGFCPLVILGPQGVEATFRAKPEITWHGPSGFWGLGDRWYGEVWYRVSEQCGSRRVLVLDDRIEINDEGLGCARR